MKKSWILILVACFCNGLVNAQQKKPVAASIFLDDPRSPVVWIDSMQTDMNHLVIDKAGIDSISLMKDSLGSGRYGQTITRGSLIIFPKPLVELVRWPVLLERLGVPAAKNSFSTSSPKTLHSALNDLTKAAEPINAPFALPITHSNSKRLIRGFPRLSQL